MLPVAEAVEAIAEQDGFAGVVSVDRGGDVEFGIRRRRVAGPLKLGPDVD